MARAASRTRRLGTMVLAGAVLVGFGGPANAASPPRKRKARPARTTVAGLVPEAAPAAAPAPLPSTPPAPVPTPSVATSSATSPISAATMTTGRDREDRVPGMSPRRRVTIGVNPLPIIVGRYGVNVDVMLVRHHAIAASAFVQTFTSTMLRVVMPDEIDASGSGAPRVGGELGYRFYTGQDGAHGLFAGVSGVAMPLVYPRVAADGSSDVPSFMAYGGAVDVGVQAITDVGFTVGGGLGVMYLAYTPPSSATPPAGVAVPSYPEPHVLPRLLLSAGWSF